MNSCAPASCLASPDSRKPATALAFALSSDLYLFPSSFPLPFFKTDGKDTMRLFNAKTFLKILLKKISTSV
jgi:hypothetical protein